MQYFVNNIFVVIYLYDCRLTVVYFQYMYFVNDSDSLSHTWSLFCGVSVLTCWHIYIPVHTGVRVAAASICKQKHLHWYQHFTTVKAGQALIQCA